MRIAQISPVGTPVLREGSDSVEQLVWVLTRELTRLGHDVTVFGAGGSDVNGKFAATLPGPCGKNGSPSDWRLCEVINLCHAVSHAAEFDVIHSHSYLFGLPLEPLARAPMVHTLHLTPGPDARALLALMPGAKITALSRSQWSEVPSFKPVAVVHHGVDTSQFTFREKPDDYVCFLGRFLREKGAIHAIAAARSLGVKLVLAGPPGDPDSNHFAERIEGEIDGKLIHYAGKVTGAERDRLLGGARALLYPIEKPEPFGLVQIEAMLCGTPVVAMRLGAVPEVVDEGVTGCTGATPEEFVAAIPRAFALDRRRIREVAEARFSAERMARDYVAIYERVIAEAKR